MPSSQRIVLPYRPILMATCLVAAPGLFVPGPAAAQTTPNNGIVSTCASSFPPFSPSPSLANFVCGNGSSAGANGGGNVGNTAVGPDAHATGGYFSTALGSVAVADGVSSTAIGAQSRALGDSSVSIGFLSTADRDYTVSVGKPDNLRQIVNVAAGTEGTDVVNLDQMQAAAVETLTTANTYTDGREAVIRTDMAAGGAATLVAANAYSDAGDAATLAGAKTYTDEREAVIRTDMAAGDAATLASAKTHTDEREAVIRTDMAAGDAATLASANTHADAGDARTLASANTYADAGDAWTLSSARTYADAGDVRTLASANLYTDGQINRLETVMNRRFRDVNIRMDQITAMSAAFAVMAGNNAGAGTGSAKRLVVGVGNYGSETAMSVGFSRVISARTAFNAGVSFTGGEVMSGGSFGLAW